MAVRTSSLGSSNASNALYSAWVNEVYNSLIAFGWVQTSDTGQSTFGGTLTAPSGTNTYPDDGIFRMADSLQSSCAVFMRIDFGEGGFADNPSMKVQVGIGGTNGAGTLTGNVAAQVVMSNASTGVSATTRNCRTTGTTSRFGLSFFTEAGVTGCSMSFWIERDRNTSGVETALGINFVAVWASSAAAVVIASQFIETAGGLGAQDTKLIALITSQASQSGGGLVGIAPVRCALGPLRNPMMAVLVSARGDFTLSTTSPVVIYGASHTYLMLRPHYTSAQNLNGWNADCGIAILWE